MLKKKKTHTLQFNIRVGLVYQLWQQTMMAHVVFSKSKEINKEWVPSTYRVNLEMGVNYEQHNQCREGTALLGKAHPRLMSKRPGRRVTPMEKRPLVWKQNECEGHWQFSNLERDGLHQSYSLMTSSAWMSNVPAFNPDMWGDLVRLTLQPHQIMRLMMILVEKVRPSYSDDLVSH